ncbi:hypothetical protein ACFYT4_15170 [Streptomyces sp. NPDC004609]|uniref:hypothetical protein n=1 Tax=Streptomyces sp. NPDC004609 TaxID=3364704 RepID=UPI0036D02C06
MFVSDGGETLSGVSDPDEGVSGLDEERPHLAGPRPPVGDRLATRVPRHAGYHGHNAPAVLSGMLLAALLITPVLWLGRDGLPGAVAWLLCAPAVSVLFAGVRSGFPRGALSDDLTWSEREEGDPSIR